MKTKIANITKHFVVIDLKLSTLLKVDEVQGMNMFIFQMLLFLVIVTGKEHLLSFKTTP